jgi:ammonium transporter Rh
MIIFYCVGTTYHEGTHSYSTDPNIIAEENLAAQETMWTHYPMWQDIHVMMFVGFGFLMVFLKTHCWASIGFNYLCAAWAIQCTMVFYGFWHKVIIDNVVTKINLDMLLLINGDFGAAAILISMGAVLGKTTFP